MGYSSSAQPQLCNMIWSYNSANMSLSLSICLSISHPSIHPHIHRFIFSNFIANVLEVEVHYHLHWVLCHCCTQSYGVERTCFNIFLASSVGSLYWPCGCVLDCSTPCTVRRKSQCCENYETKSWIWKNKNCFLKKERKHMHSTASVYSTWFIIFRAVTHSYPTLVFAQTFMLWHFSYHEFKLHYTAFLFMDELFHYTQTFTSPTYMHCAYILLFDVLFKLLNDKKSHSVHLFYWANQ